MNSHDKIALEISNLFEKYDFYNNRQRLVHCLEDEPNIWKHDDTGFPMDGFVRNAFLEVIDNNRNYFDNYVCPFSQLYNIVNSKKVLSSVGLEILENVETKFIDTEFKHKMFIHNWLNKNISNIKEIVEKDKKFMGNEELDLDDAIGVNRLSGGGMEINFDLVSEFEETDEDNKRWDFYDELEGKVMKPLIADYIKHFKTSIELDWNYLIKEVKPYAQGNQTYYFDEEEDFNNVFDVNDTVLLNLFQTPEKLNKESKKREEQQEKEKKTDMEYLKKQSAALFG